MVKDLKPTRTCANSASDIFVWSSSFDMSCDEPISAGLINPDVDVFGLSLLCWSAEPALRDHETLNVQLWEEMRKLVRW
jgi:hypothetical protein